MMLLWLVVILIGGSEKRYSKTGRIMNIDAEDIIITSKYGSHLPILGTIFSNCNISSVFEFGCGLFSTAFFLKYANDS